MDTNKEMLTVLVVEPAKEPYVKEIGAELDDLQREVGGYIEAVSYYYGEPVAIICDETGKMRGKEPNRALRDRNGPVYDVVCGTFLVVGIGEEDFSSLESPYIETFKEHFRLRTTRSLGGSEVPGFADKLMEVAAAAEAEVANSEESEEREEREEVET